MRQTDIFCSFEERIEAEHFCLKAETFIKCTFIRLCTKDTCDEVSGPVIFAARLTAMEVA